MKAGEMFISDLHTENLAGHSAVIRVLPGYS